MITNTDSLVCESYQSFELYQGNSQRPMPWVAHKLLVSRKLCAGFTENTLQYTLITCSESFR